MEISQLRTFLSNSTSSNLKIFCGNYNKHTSLFYFRIVTLIENHVSNPPLQLSPPKLFYLAIMMKIIWTTSKFKSCVGFITFVRICFVGHISPVELRQVPPPRDCNIWIKFISKTGFFPQTSYRWFFTIINCIKYMFTGIISHFNSLNFFIYVVFRSSSWKLYRNFIILNLIVTTTTSWRVWWDKCIFFLTTKPKHH